MDGLAKSYSVQRKVRADDFKDLTLRAVIAANPLALKGLRKFERLLRDLALFGPTTVSDIDLDFDLVGPDT